MSVVKSRTFGRADLVQELKTKCGLPRRQAIVVVNTILHRMIWHLRHGHTVEAPYGTLKRVRRYFGQGWEWDDDWPADRDPFTIDYQSEKPAHSRVR